MWECSFIHFEVTVIRFDSHTLRMTCECIGVYISTVQRWMLGASVCVQDAWESSFFYSEVTIIRFDSCALRLLVNVLECISALVCKDVCWVCACASRMCGKSHLSI